MFNCFRYLGFTDWNKVYEVGWNEYNFMWAAYLAKQDDEMEKIHMGAWLNELAKGRTKDGKKSLFPKFSDFYIPTKYINPELKARAKRLMAYRRGKEE